MADQDKEALTTETEPAPTVALQQRHWSVGEIAEVIGICKANGVRAFSAVGLELSFERPAQKRGEMD